MQTSRDCNIISFIQKYEGATAKQIGKIFFGLENGYALARRRMKILENNKLVKAEKDWVTKNKIYYIDKIPSVHRLKCLDVYAEIVGHGAEIIQFEVNYNLFGCQTDAFIIYKAHDTGRIVLVEIDLYNKTHPEKYLETYKSNEFQEKYGIFPLILIISNYAKEDSSYPFKVIWTNYKLDGLKNILKL